MTARDVAGYVLALELERDTLRTQLEAERNKYHVGNRLLYRRGYSTGYAAAQRGQIRVTNPEAKARGATLELLDVA